MATNTYHYQTESAPNVWKSWTNCERSFTNSEMVAQLSSELFVLWFYCWHYGGIDIHTTRHCVRGCGGLAARIWAIRWFLWCSAILAFWQLQGCNHRWKLQIEFSFAQDFSTFVLFHRTNCDFGIAHKPLCSWKPRLCYFLIIYQRCIDFLIWIVEFGIFSAVHIRTGMGKTFIDTGISLLNFCCGQIDFLLFW